MQCLQCHFEYDEECQEDRDQLLSHTNKKRIDIDQYTFNFYPTFSIKPFSLGNFVQS